MDNLRPAPLPPAEPLERIPSPPGAAFREFRIVAMPFLMFGAALIALVLMWRDYVGPAALVGEVESVRSVIAASAPGRLGQIHVDSLAKVRAGQAIVQLLPVEPRVLDAQIALTKARIDLIRAGMDPDLRKQNNRINFENLRLDWLSKRVELATAKAKLQFNELELERQRGLFVDLTNIVWYTGTNRTSYGAPAAVQVAERDVNATRAEVQELQQLVDTFASSMTAIAPGEAKLDDEASASIRAAIGVEERNLDLIEAQMAPITLTAPFDGTVSLVYRRSGESVLAGEPIVSVARDRGTRVVAFVRQPLSLQPTVGMKVEVRSRGSRRSMGVGEVVSVGTQLEPVLPTLLPRTTAGTGVPLEYGLPLLVNLPPELAVLPGELVDLRPLER
jgi:multidrug resistance efflux pump